MSSCLLISESPEGIASAIPNVPVAVADGPSRIERALRSEERECILLDGRMNGSRSPELWTVLDEAVRARPFQLLALCFTPESRWNGFVGRVDDIVYRVYELPVRIDLALGRLRRLKAIWSESEFYRRAVREEEVVSSRIVEHTIGLRHAYCAAERTNLELARSHRELERISRLDSLSGLLNRSSLFAAVDAELERSDRTGTPLCGVMMDIDRFKSINDTYGHACGDTVLRSVGALLQRELRKYDQAGRYGGEEFFIVLPNTDVAAAGVFAERLRRRLASLPIEYADGTVRVAASFGVAHYRSGEGRDSWVGRADSALYAAKRVGRNRVVSAGEGP